jgi:hypothetical protein
VVQQFGNAEIAGVFPTVRIVRIPGLPTHGDAVDFIDRCRRNDMDDQRIRSELEALCQREELVEVLSPRARLTSVADVEPEPLTWLWKGRIPLGKLTLIAGDPGL